jgi:TatA/E family protein of Tat protein translocase
MFGSVGGPEILLIFVLALLLFGPRKLPEIGRALGKTVAEFRKATAEFRSTLEREVDMEKLKDTGVALKSAGSDTADAVRGRSIFGELAAALRPEPFSKPYGGAVLAGKAAPAPAPSPVPAGSSAVASTAPIPFSDETSPVPDPDAAPPAPAPTEHVAKQQES